MDNPGFPRKTQITLNQARADAVFAAIAAGALWIDMAAPCTLDDVHLVHARIEAREQLGKSVVWIDERHR